ncbi:hypothetical protein COLO4_30548 [Corchorus olitorius]|uniref:F-box domain-containing protein n=1 Tax=Corchorus olitorius TaxID=93759 RepID=A0A1R3H852_9ROSI|nr:hypothetical protein COLO4_30548 [Corchorus olitorius]
MGNMCACAATGAAMDMDNRRLDPVDASDRISECNSAAIGNISADMGNMSTAMDNMRLDPSYALPSATDRIYELPEDIMNNMRLEPAYASPSATDRISELPEDVMNRILFFLPAKEAARTSILSKNWLSLWNSLPIFYFCSLSLPGRNNLLKNDCPDFGANVNE